MRHLRTAASAGVIALLALGLGLVVWSKPAASPSGASVALPPLAPEKPVEPAPDGCAGAAELVDLIPQPIEALAATSTSVFIGTVSEVGPAQWNTEDGKPPERGEGDIAPFDVLRLVRVEVLDPLKGKATPNPATVWIRGGRIGCSLFTYSEYPDEILKGDQFAFFVDDATPEIDMVGMQRATLMWPIDKDGLVASPFEGRLSLSEFAEAVSAAAQPK